VFLSVCIPWGAVRDVLGLRYVCRPPIVMHGCAVYNAQGCCYGLGQAVGTVGPPAPISSRDGVLPRCSLPYVLQTMCFILIIFTLGEGVYISAFSCMLSKYRSSHLTGLVGHMCPVFCGFPLSAWCISRVFSPLSFGGGVFRCFHVSVCSVCHNYSLLIRGLFLRSL
jgi:hypothetical protein